MTRTTYMARRSAVTLVAAVAAAVSYPATAMALGLAAAGAGARVAAERRLGARSLDLMIDSPAVGREVPVRLILPAGYPSDPDRRWPVLYLLHGGHDDYTSWTRETDIEAFVADKDVLTVMPDAGPTGFPTHWWGHGSPGAPDYERFQVDEVMEVLQRDYRASGVRVVAGISTGGYGAMAHAARRPGAFRAAASYSGLLDTTRSGIPPFVKSIVARESLPPLTLWGDPKVQAENWHAHNPRDRAAGLRGTPLYVSSGSGVLKRSGDPWDAGLLESIMWTTAESFTARLRELDIPVTAHLYHGGAHTWPHWWREFQLSWPLLAQGLGLPGGAGGR